MTEMRERRFRSMCAWEDVWADEVWGQRPVWAARLYYLLFARTTVSGRRW